MITWIRDERSITEMGLQAIAVLGDHKCVGGLSYSEHDRLKPAGVIENTQETLSAKDLEYIVRNNVLIFAPHGRPCRPSD